MLGVFAGRMQVSLAWLAVGVASAALGCAPQVPGPSRSPLPAPTPTPPEPGGVVASVPRALKDWPFCPLQLVPKVESDALDVEMNDGCQTLTTSLTPCADGPTVVAELRRCCVVAGSDTLCDTSLSMGDSALALAQERIGSNDVEGDFDSYQSELERVPLGQGVEVLAQRYTHASFIGRGSVLYILYAWNGSKITPILERTVRQFSTSELFYEERLTFVPRADGVADITVNSVDAPEGSPEPAQTERVELRFSAGQYR